MEQEIFKTIENYADYTISNMGRVYSFKRNKFLKPIKNTGGYFIINLMRNNKAKVFYIHHLVAKAFLLKPSEKLQLNHISGVKSENQYYNLEWLTPQQNTRHAWQHGLCSASRGEQHGRSKLSENQVIEIRKDNRTYEDIALSYNISVSSVYFIKTRKIWKHI